MSSYKKYIMMGVTTILIPIGKLLLQKAINKMKEEPEEEEYALEEKNEFVPGAGRYRRDSAS